MAKAIGPSFATELRAAGVLLDGIAWGADGAFCFRDDVPQTVLDQVAAVYAAHDPTAPGPSPAPTPRVWLERLPADRQEAITDAVFTAGGAARLWYIRALGTPAIDVTSAETVQGIAAMVAAGIVTAAEQAILLAP